MKNGAFLCLFIAFLTACSSIETIQVSVQKPAQMTLPLNVRNLTIVNNAVMQPDSIGHFVFDKEEKPVAISSNGVDTVLVQALSQFMTEENFFDQVRTQNKSLRTDNSFLSENLINPKTIQSIAEETNADAIISLDKFITRSIHRKKTMYGTDVLDLKMQAKFRVYSPNGKLMNYPILFEDTLYWDNSDYKVKLPSQEEALHQAALYTADKMVTMFIPFWQEQNRWIYIDSNSKSKQATKEAKENKWKEAALLWGELWNTEEKNAIKKAKLASNIAIANEMLDDIENASNWAKISYDLFYPERKKEIIKEDFIRIEALKEELEQRVIDLRMLNEQKGNAEEP